MKPFDKIRMTPGGNILFIFDHGLGDMVHYLPVHLEFERQVGKSIILSSPDKRQYESLSPIVKPFNTLKDKRFDYVYKIQYPDASEHSLPFEYHKEPSKPYLCSQYELGMKLFNWKPLYELRRWCSNKNSKRVGVHFFGHTGINEKFCPHSIAYQIWQEIEDAGYEPFECHLIPHFTSDYKCLGSDDCDFINQYQTIRHEDPDLKLLLETIGSCKFFIGVDAGPLYLAASILGYDRVIGLERYKRIAYFSPKHIPVVPITEYVSGAITQQLNLRRELS